jgi:hypothetical protein
MKTLRYITVGVLILISTSCADYFDLKRPPQPPWSSLSDFEQAAIGLYAGLFSGADWNMAFVNERIVKSSMGDDVGFVKNPEWGYNRNTKEYNVYTEKNFALLYGVISAANNALDFVKSHNGNPFPNEPQTEIDNNFNRLVGEIHFARGYAYYMLMTTFGHAYVPGGDNTTRDIPLRTEFITSAQEARNPVIGTTQEVYDFIRDDFEKAKEMLPPAYVPGLHHPSYEIRANKFAASAMLVRTYLQRGEYDKAKSECDFIIDQNNGTYDLTEDPIQAFNKSSKARGREVIFFAPFYDASLPPPNHLSVINHSWSNKPTEWVETYMSVKTVKHLGWMNDPASDTTITIIAKRDKRFTQLMAIRLPQGVTRAGLVSETRPNVKDLTTIWNNKYYRGPGGMLSNVPLIRLAEIYLTRSVLRFRSNDKSGAADDLNVVRRRAWNPQIGGVYVPLTATEISEELINDERMIELFNEGDRLDYLRGMKVDVPRGDRGNGVDPYTSEDFVWAMPALELNFDDSLKGG